MTNRKLLAIGVLLGSVGWERAASIVPPANLGDPVTLSDLIARHAFA